MVSALIILLFFVFVGVYDKNKRLKRQRQRAEQARLERKREQEDFERRYPQTIIKVSFPNPATSTIEDIKEYITGEYNFDVLNEYLRISKELNAPSIVEIMIANQISYCRERLNK